MVQLPGPPPGPPPQGVPQPQPPQAFHPGGMHHGGMLHPGAAKPPLTKEQKLAIALGICGVTILIASLSKSWFTVGGDYGMEGRIGPSGVEYCVMGTCADQPWSMLTGNGRGDLGGEVPILAGIGMIAAIAAAAGVIATGALVWMKNMLHRVPIQPTWIAFGVAAFCCTLMEVRLFMASAGSFKGSIGSAAVVAIAAMVTAAILLQKIAPSVAMAKAHAAPPSHLSGGQPYGGPPMGMFPPPFGGQPPQFGGQPPQFGGQPPMEWPQQTGTAPAMAAPGGPGAPAVQPGSPCLRCQRSLVFVAQYQQWFCESCKQYA